MANESNKSIFEVLSAIDCSEHIEVKKSTYKDKYGREHELALSYLSWAWAWHICKKHYPDAEYIIYETPEGRPYFDDGRTAWVKTGVKIDGLEHIEYLPIMDHRNLSIPVERITSMDMNKAIQRSLTKAVARHGLGLYIYAGEDLPYTEEEAAAIEAEQQAAAPKKKATKKAAPAPQEEAAPLEEEIGPASELILQMKKEVYRKWVAGIAEGKSKDGVTWHDAFIEQYKPNKTQREQLEKDVLAYQLQNAIYTN